MAGMTKAAFWAIVFTVIVCSCAAVFTGYFLRRKRGRPPTKQPSSELQINAGDGQYVVAYTLKPPKQAQPDILNPPPDGSVNKYSTEESVKNGALVARDEWGTSDRCPGDDVEETTPILTSPRTSMSSKQPFNTMTLSRREHLIAEEIPGPESCV